MYPLYKIRGSSQAPPLRVSVEFDNQVVDMKVDTGAACSLMSEVSFRRNSGPPASCRRRTFVCVRGNWKSRERETGRERERETGTGNENLREAAGAEMTRSSRLLSSREPGTSRSKDSR